MRIKHALLSAVFAIGLIGADKDDGVIETKLKMRLAKDAVAKGGGFGVVVTNGVATLTGRVESEKQKSRAEKLAHKERGVKSVENRLQVIPK